jgi:hypothetical protein
MNEQLAVTLSLLVLASAVGAIWRLSQGRIRQTSTDISPALLSPGHWLTLLQVSSPLCSYCGAMRGILSAAAARFEGVAHVEYDISEIPQVIEALEVRQTPTTFLVAADGRVIHQVGGAAAPRVIDELIEQAKADVSKRSNEYTI